MNKYLFTAGITVFTLFVTSFPTKAQQADNKNFEINKSLDIFNSLFKELNMFYVDSITPKKSMDTGIKAMLEDLDPYTEYYSEDNMSELKLMTTGEYAGIGSTIVQRDGKIYISEPYENMPATISGLQAGDEILEINDENITGINSSLVSEKLKGQPNTIVKIKYKRQGEKDPKTVKIERKLIHINSVTYYGVMENNTGYIYLSTFTDQSAQEVKAAFEDLKKNHHITSLILDLRNNGGGLMDDAIQLVNMFVPKGKVVLTTKGKIKQWDRTYRTTQNSIDEEIPLAVLVNHSSASSSEILAGALQDLDRAVIVGLRTYGKGLVQSTRELPYNGSLKLTISKYYIPSGRCIQAIDYTHRNPDGSAGIIPDSLTSIFYTSKGRPVRDGGGITPDFITKEKKMSNIAYYLMVKYVIFDFANEWKRNHKTIDPAEKFELTSQDYESFKKFVKSKDFDYDRQSKKMMQSLKEVMEFEGYMDTASAEFAALEQKLSPDIDRDLDFYKDELTKIISMEIANRYYYQKGEMIQSLKKDEDLEKAIEVLANKELYNSTLKVGEATVPSSASISE